MKKALCHVISALSILSSLWFLFVYLYSSFNPEPSLGLFRAMEISILADLALIAAIVILGLTYVKITTDGWFPEKDKPLIGREKAVFIIVAIFGAAMIALFMIDLFIGYFDDNTAITALDNVKTRSILLALGNLISAYAFYKAKK